MMENIPPKGVSFSVFICTFAMSFRVLSVFKSDTKISEISGMAKSGLLQRSVVKYVTCVIRRDFGMLLAKNCQKAKSHTHKEFASVHGSSAHHSIIAIVTCVQKVII